MTPRCETADFALDADGAPDSDARVAHRVLSRVVDGGPLLPDGSRRSNRRRLPWRRLLWPICILLVIAAATVERHGGLALKKCFLHDEVIALMSATCHQGDYERARLDLANRWVSAPEWKSLLTTRRVACFGLIRDDLVEYDIHPPLYFWLLHVAGLFTGFDATTGARLNIVIHAIALAALMVLTRTLTGSRLSAIAAALLWSFSIVALETTFTARQYELLGGLGVFAVLALHRTLTSERHPRLHAAALAVTLSLLTLTQWFGLIGSVFVGAVALGLAVIELVCRRRGSEPPVPATRSRELAAAWVGAQALTLAIHPHIIQHFRSASGSALREVETAALPQRVKTTLQTLGDYLGLARGDERWGAVLVVTGVSIAFVLVPFWQLWRAYRAAGKETGRALADACAAFAIPLFGVVVTVPFILGLGSRHSMSARYLSLLWPLWALGLVWPFTFVVLRARGAAVRAAGAALGLLGFVAWPVWNGHAAKEDSPPLCGGDTKVSRALPLVRAVVTDNTHRGTFGPSIPFFRDDALVFALPPPRGAVPERPTPPPLDVPELVQGLERVDAVSIFHHPGGEITPNAVDDLRHALDVANLEAMRVNEWLFALDRMVLFVSYRTPRRGGAPIDVVDQLRRRGSTVPNFNALDGYAAVLVDGKLQKESSSLRGAARLSTKDLSVPSEEFSIVSSPRDATIIVAGSPTADRRPGFLVVAYDPVKREIVYRTVFQPGNLRQRPWSDVFARTAAR